MPGWVKWLFAGLFLLLMVVIQFVPGESAENARPGDSGPAAESSEG